MGENKLLRTIETRAPSSGLENLAREHTEEALNVIIQIMKTTQDERTRLMAARMLRDRGWVNSEARNEIPSETSARSVPWRPVHQRRNWRTA
jgi:hypothetical protein